jgi:hypothetical protein
MHPLQTIYVCAIIIASYIIVDAQDASESKSWKFDVTTKSEAYQKAKSSGVGFNDDGSEVR